MSTDKPRVNRRPAPRVLALGCSLGAVLALSLAAPDSAQVRPSKSHEGALKPASADACCNIVSVDGVSGTATAKDKSTGQLLTFTVTDAALLQSLHMGQPVYVDQQTQKVSVDGISPCCELVSGVGKPVGVGAVQPAWGDACCGIVSIDGAAGTATAKDKTTGEVITFQVPDQTLLQKLQLGQAVYADRGTQKVSVDGAQPCCAIVASGVRPVGVQQVKPAWGETCCGITSVDQGAGTATAKNTTTGEVITFAVPDKSVLQGLQVGQAVYADTKTQKVSVDGIDPCCNLVTGVGAPKGPAQAHVAGAQPCCQVVANSALKGRLGRVVVAFPAGANAGGTQVQVFKAGATEALNTGYGSQQIELLPGNYTVSISNKRVNGVTVKAGHDTQVRVGVVRINAGGSTQGEVLDADRKTSLSSGFGNQSVGLPVGTYQLKIAGQTEPITVKEGKITEF